MESPTDIKAALTTRARTATLDELRTEGKRRVRVVKADQVAAMIEESVHRAVEQSGLLPASEVEKLVERSRQEFRTLLKAREAEAERAQAMQELLDARDREVADLRLQLAAARAAQHAAETALADAQVAVDAAAADGEATSSAQADMLSSLMNEMASMKAALLAHPVAVPPAREALAVAPSPAPAGAVAAAAAAATPAPIAAAAAAPALDVSAAIEKLATSLNDRFEKLGRKLGISSAVGNDQPVDLGGLFKDSGPGLESNINNVASKQKAAGGIAANLARLKKLKGGG
ncbi:MAG: hypothetical protein ACK5BN_11965 [Planctomycetota bacterium]